MPSKSYRRKLRRKLSIFRAQRAALDWETYRATREAYLEALPPIPHNKLYLPSTREQLDNWLIGYIPIAHPLLIPLLTRDLTFIIDSFLGYDHYPFRFLRPRKTGLAVVNNWEIGLTAHPILLELLTEVPTSIIGLFFGYDSRHSSPW
jgi:hypothetical protein